MRGSRGMGVGWRGLIEFELQNSLFQFQFFSIPLTPVGVFPYPHTLDKVAEPHYWIVCWKGGSETPFCTEGWTTFPTSHLGATTGMFKVFNSYVFNIRYVYLGMKQI